MTKDERVILGRVKTLIGDEIAACTELDGSGFAGRIGGLETALSILHAAGFDAMVSGAVTDTPA